MSTQPAAAVSAPADRSATSLRCTLVGDQPRHASRRGRFSVWAAETDQRELVLLGGVFDGIDPGEQVVCHGRWQHDRRHGWLFRTLRVEPLLRESEEGVARWLAARLPGIGETFARAATAHFGADRLFAVLDGDPNALGQVRTPSGRTLPAAKVAELAAIWPGLRATRRLEARLLGAGATPRLLDQLFRRFGPELPDVLARDPYAASGLRGVGFKRADVLARGLGLRADDPARLRAGVLYLLEQALAADGHMFLTRRQLLERARSTLGVDAPLGVRAAVRDLARAEALVVEADGEEPRAYLRSGHELERRVARRLRRGRLEPPTAPLYTPPAAPAEPTPAQWRIVEQVAAHRLTALSGGPGTGKTFALRTLVEVAAAAGVEVALAAPTGKAARRIAELVGRPASTVHRLLEFRPTSGKFERNARKPLEGLVIVDEASMLDLPLADALLTAIGPNAHLLLVGDPDQLPPVGPGRMFADLLESHVLADAHVELRDVIRQAAGSLVVANARRIREGRLPFMTQDEAVAELGDDVERDCFIVRRTNPEAVEETVVELVCRQLPRTFQIDAREIVVLAPMRAGSAGVDRLNALLEQRLNRPDAPVVHEPTGIRVGSRVVQCRNDYGSGVMNGELARVAGLDRRAGTVELLLEDERRLTLPAGSLESWRLAWCLSVHRFQGSEADLVVVALSSAAELVDRSLLYTALTRARKAAVIVSSQRVLAIAVGRPGAARNTTLVRRLTDPQSSGELF